MIHTAVLQQIHTVELHTTHMTGMARICTVGLHRTCMEDPHRILTVVDFMTRMADVLQIHMLGLLWDFMDGHPQILTDTKIPMDEPPRTLMAVGIVEGVQTTTKMKIGNTGALDEHRMVVQQNPMVMVVGMV